MTKNVRNCKTTKENKQLKPIEYERWLLFILACVGSGLDHDK